MWKVYFIKNRVGILTFLVLAGLQAVLLGLYGVNSEPILYLMILELFFFAVSYGISFASYYRKYKKLQQIEASIFSSVDQLPEFAEPMTEQMRNLLTEYDREYRHHMNDIVIEKQEMADYYVLWTHQIKTPITSMRLLLQSNEHPQNAELSAELFKIEQYVQMALSYVRMNDMQNDMMLRKTSVDECVKTALRKFSKEFIRRRLSVTYSEMNWEVVTDEKWLTFVIEQVLSNALKYTKSGGITIIREGDDLVISDTGIGIRKEDLPRIFDKGFTGYNGRADRKSTGIGLYLCARIMQNLSFKISVESEVGVGTKLHLLMPPNASSDDFNLTKM